MAKIGSMMDMGKRSMMNSQTALQTVSHNIANKSTEGYSRQRVDLQTAVPITEGRLQLGQGNRAASVSRTNNPYLEKQLQQETASFGYQTGRSDSMSRVEQVFNEQMNKGLNQYMSDFFNSFRELASSPESITTRQMVKESADALTTDFKRVQTQMEEIQNEVDETIKAQLSEVNKMVEEISGLNEQVASTEIQGIPANDQRDRRDLLLKKLNEKLNIKWAEGNNGMVHVSTAGNAILVSGFDSYQLNSYRDSQSGRLQISYSNGDGAPPLNITDRVQGGSIGGSLSVRDETIEQMKDRMDMLAFSLAKEVNRVHRQGIDRGGRPGEDFFTTTGEVKGAAENLGLSEFVKGDVTRIAAGIREGATGDNTVANVISQIQQKGVLEEGSATLDDFYTATIGTIGVLTQRAVKSKEAQENILNQMNTIRESISGVSLDEETAKMIEFQKAFDASARIIRTADEMFDTVLSLKRV